MLILTPWRASTAQATSLRALSLKQVVRLSAFVFRAEVTAATPVETSRGEVWTHYDLRLIELWKGDPRRVEEALTLTLKGGVVGEGITLRGQMIHGQPQLKRGDEGVFFLERSVGGQLVFTGMSQGWYPLEVRQEQLWAVRSSDYRAHLHGKREAQRFQGAPDIDALPLAQLRSYVKYSTHAPPPPLSLDQERSARTSPAQRVEEKILRGQP